MNNRELFEDGPKLIKCDGCGRYVEEQMLKKCRACGKSFCPNCRPTHDCRETAAGSEVPPVVIRDINEYNAADKRYGSPATADEASAPRNRIELTFIDADGSSIGGASLRENASYGSYQRYDSEGRRISFNDFAEASIGSADLKRYDNTTKVYGDNGYAATEPEPQVVRQPPNPQHLYTPMPRENPVYHPERTTPSVQEPPFPPQNSVYHPEERGSYSAPQPDRAATDLADAAPKYAYNALVIDAPLALAEDELRCDDCGKIWKKSQLRKCKKCGAVLCPECRDKHKCSKNQKAKNKDTESAEGMQENAQHVRKEHPPKKQERKKTNKKMTLILIFVVIFLVAIAVAVLMIKGVITPMMQ